MIFCALYALVLATGLFFHHIDATKEEPENGKKSAEPLPRKKQTKE